jgi:hypothetical protein
LIASMSVADFPAQTALLLGEMTGG